MVLGDGVISKVPDLPHPTSPSLSSPTKIKGLDPTSHGGCFRMSGSPPPKVPLFSETAKKASMTSASSPILTSSHSFSSSSSRLNRFSARTSLSPPAPSSLDLASSSCSSKFSPLSPQKDPQCKSEAHSPDPPNVDKQQEFSNTSSPSSSSIRTPISPLASRIPTSFSSRTTQNLSRSESSVKPTKSRAKRKLTVTEVLETFGGKRTRSSGRQLSSSQPLTKNARNNIFNNRNVTAKTLREETLSWAERAKNCLANLRVTAELGLLDYMCHIMPAFDDLQCRLSFLNTRLRNIKYSVTGSQQEMNAKYMMLLTDLAEEMGQLSLEQAVVLAKEETSLNTGQDSEKKAPAKEVGQKASIEPAGKRQKDEASKKKQVEEIEKSLCKEIEKNEREVPPLETQTHEVDDLQPLSKLKRQIHKQFQSVPESKHEEEKENKKPIETNGKQEANNKLPSPPSRPLPPSPPSVPKPVVPELSEQEKQRAEWARQKAIEAKKKERKERERRQAEEARRLREEEDRKRNEEESRKCAELLELQRLARFRKEAEAQESARQKAGKPPPSPPPPDPSTKDPPFDEGTEGDDDTRWQAFVTKFGDHKGGRVQFSDVPWPRDEFRPPSHDLQTVQKYFKKLLLRWHPDKFNVYGESMDVGIMAKVTSIAQTIIPRWNVFSSR